MLPPPPSPFFIVGHPRSGTTLLRYILSNHADLYVPFETGFLPFLSVSPGEKLSLRKTEELLREIGSLNKEWRAVVSDVRAFYGSLPAATVDYLLDSLYRRQLSRQGIVGAEEVRWGDKTPGYVNYIPELARVFPAGQFIHIIRDGRDTTLSAQQKWGNRHWYMDDYYLMTQWSRNVEAGREAGRGLGPERYLELHYEALVQEPEKELRRICTFLKEPFMPALLAHTELTSRVSVGPHQEVKAPITATRVARWRREMSPFARKLAHRIAGPVLVAAGYPLADESPMTLAETGRYWALRLKFRVLDLARRLLYRMGILSLNRGKRG